jgi:hypothetical protein
MVAGIPDLPANIRQQLAQADQLDASDPAKAAQMRAELYTSGVLAVGSAAGGSTKLVSRLSGKTLLNTSEKILAQIDEGKFDYLFGRVSSNAHNLPRSLQNQQQLARIGIYDTSAGRQLLINNLNKVVNDPSSITNKFSKTVDGVVQNFETRQSLLAGPGGFLRLDISFEIMPNGSRRLTTLIPQGGQ